MEFSGSYKIDFESFGLGGDLHYSTVSISVIPDTTRGTSGYGDTVVNISSLNAKTIVSVTFTGSNFMLWGLQSLSSTSMTVFGYRNQGSFGSTIGGTAHILYTK